MKFSTGFQIILERPLFELWTWFGVQNAPSHSELSEKVKNGSLRNFWHPGNFDWKSRFSAIFRAIYGWLEISTSPEISTGPENIFFFEKLHFRTGGVNGSSASSLISRVTRWVKNSRADTRKRIKNTPNIFRAGAGETFVFYPNKFSALTHKGLP